MISSDNIEQQRIINLMASKQIIMACDDNIIFDNEIHRFQLDCDKDSKKSGWYSINDNYINFGSWKTDERYSLKLNDQTCTAEFVKEKVDRKVLLERQQKLLDSQNIAAEAAWNIWESASACLSHRYLDNKTVNPYGLRVYNENILVPLINGKGELRSLQFINNDGSKWFHKKGEIKGNYFFIGDINKSEKAFICEGYSTAATLYAVTGIPQVISFNAGNLTKVSNNIRERLPNTDIFIAADNDSYNEINTGLVKGKQAARSINATLIYPEFINGDIGSDFNDFAKLYGNTQLLDLLNCVEAL